MKLWLWGFLPFLHVTVTAGTVGTKVVSREPKIFQTICAVGNHSNR